MKEYLLIELIYGIAATTLILTALAISSIGGP
jgi:hypothetical protein